jgi:hypothetical protein
MKTKPVKWTELPYYYDSSNIGALLSFLIYDEISENNSTTSIIDCKPL